MVKISFKNSLITDFYFTFIFEDDFKDGYFSWCLENQFELVENPDEEDEEEEEEEGKSKIKIF